jgi:DNA-binding MarR family transcriptional regulator
MQSHIMQVHNLYTHQMHPHAIMPAEMGQTKETTLVGEWREFEVLERLANEGECSVRVHAIAEHMHLSQSALSRVLDRLEKHGLLKRGVCDNDRRAMFAELTPAGRERYEAARPTHREVLARELA